MLGFSYSGLYENCANGRQVAADEYPFGDYRVFPKYQASNTCAGVRDAAIKLDSLLTAFTSQEPERELVIIGHSLGGMVAVYYVAELASPEIRNRIRSVLTIDAPLLGYADTSPFSNCHDEASSWRDILGLSDIVTKIESIEGTVLARKFVHLNSSEIGDSLSGGREVILECGTKSAQDWGILGALFGTLVTGGWGGLIAGALAGETYGAYAAGHNCGFYDTAALGEIMHVLQR